MMSKVSKRSALPPKTWHDKIFKSDSKDRWQWLACSAGEPGMLKSSLDITSVVLSHDKQHQNRQHKTHNNTFSFIQFYSQRIMKHWVICWVVCGHVQKSSNKEKQNGTLAIIKDNSSGDSQSLVSMMCEETILSQLAPWKSGKLWLKEVVAFEIRTSNQFDATAWHDCWSFRLQKQVKTIRVKIGFGDTLHWWI